MSKLKRRPAAFEEGVVGLIPEEWRIQTTLFERLLVGPDWVGRLGCLFRRHVAVGRERWRIRKAPSAYRGKQPRGRSAYAISYALTGQADLLGPDGETHPLSPGTLFAIVRPADTYRHRVRAHGPFLECSLVFDYATGAMLDRLGLWPRDLTVATVGLKAPLVSGYVRLAERLADPAAESGAVFRHAITFLEQLDQSLAGHQTPSGFAARACRLLRENPQPGFSMQAAASLLGLPYHDFRRRFRREVGLSPNQYQLRERLNLARELLATHSVKETADLLGYTDEYFFSNQFRKIVGARPKQFRP